ncbi:MAG: tetratricopeptide repeat protein [Phycisphaerae bacterium]
MKPTSLLCLCVCLCAAGLLGCDNPHKKAALVVNKELSKLQENSRHSAELYRQALAARDANNAAGARKLLQDAVEIDNRNARAWMTLGILLYEKDDLARAAQAFDSAAKAEPNRYEPHYNLGIVLEAAGRYERAIEEYEMALTLCADQNEVRENLARCLIKNRAQPQNAKRLIEQALRVETRPEWVSWLNSQLRTLTQENEVSDVR